MTTATPRANWQDIIEAHDGDSAYEPQVSNRDLLMPADRFVKRHIGPRSHDVTRMLQAIGLNSLDELVKEAVPATIRMDGYLDLDPPQIYRSFIGMGYYDCIMPPVVQRNVLENPGWYTAYTPYQPEIAQGRLEALINFQTMVMDLTGMEIANASLLDEGTAAAEAMTLCMRQRPRRSTANIFFVSDCATRRPSAWCAPAPNLLRHRSGCGPHTTYDFSQPTFGALVQYPATNGDVLDYEAFIAKAHEAQALAVVATDLLALTLLRPPGELGADVVVGNSQRFGVPMGFGGPHAAFFATRDKLKRSMPGRSSASPRTATAARPAHGDADPRAAHPPREGHQQHLHRPGAAGRAWPACMPSIMAPRACGHRPAGPPPERPCWPTACRRTTRLPASTMPLSSTPCASAAGRTARLHPPGALTHTMSTCATSTTARRRLPRREPPPTTSTACSTIFGEERVEATWRRWPMGGRHPRRPSPRERLPDPPRLQRATTPRRRCCATSSAWRTATSR
jgi:hypothetical protein